MKQSLLSPGGSIRSGCISIGLFLLSFKAFTQTQSPDTLQTGYGSRSLSKITEKAVSLQPQDLKKGLITSTEQLLAGQVAGLRVIPKGGAPGAGAQMILRSGTSVFGNNAPLLVLDGIPLDHTSASDHAGFLHFLNPNDIASITLLKDAASQAVYGGRAANGVLYITTKSVNETSQTKLDYTSNAGISFLQKKADVLTAGELRELVRREFPEQGHVLGNHDTDWQDAIYRKAFSHDETLSLSGALFKAMPYRVSFGHLSQNGILKTSQAKRNSLALSLNPSLLQDHLQLNLYLRKVNEQVRVADKNAITAARAFDPTQPVYQNNKYGGYFAYQNPDGTLSRYANANPLSMLEQREDEDETSTLYGQAHLQYKFHFLPALKLNLRYAFQDQENDFSTYQSANLPTVAWQGGWAQNFDRTKEWNQKEAFLLYEKPVEKMQSRLRLMAGATARKLYHERNVYPVYNGKGDVINQSRSFESIEKTYTSLFGQATFQVKDRYLLEAAMAKEQTSSLPSAEHAVLTGSVGTSWDIAKEPFLANNAIVSNLRLYANYNNFAKPEHSSIMMNSILNPQLRYEKTARWNAGFSWGVLDDRLSGSLNYYKTSTTDMLLHMVVGSGSGYTNRLMNNGGFETAGLEATVRYQLIAKPEFSWSIGSNLSYQRSEVSDFEHGTLYYLYGEKLALNPGSPVHSFYVFEQLYDESGKPIEKGYKKDPRGMDERQVLHSVDPDFVVGVHSALSYKKISAGLLLRGTSGNYVFNLADASRSSLYMAAGYRDSYVENISGSYAETEFKSPQLHSSHFLENASFLRLEYLQLAYDFGRVMGNKADLKLNATVQNAFVLTRYSGQDPEVTNGIDKEQYPQPRTFSLGLNLSI